MRTSLFSSNSPEWEDVVNLLPCDIYHLPAYFHVASWYEGGDAYGFLAEEGAKRLFVPFLLRRIPKAIANAEECFDITSPYGYAGPVATADATSDERFLVKALHKLVDCMRSLNAVTAFFRLHPFFSPPANLLREMATVNQHGETVYVDLTTTAEEFWNGIRANHRRDIRKLQSLGGRVVLDVQMSRTEDFLRAYYDTMERVGANEFYLFPREYFDRLKAAISGSILLLLVEIDDETASAGLFSEMNGVVQYLYGGTRTRYLRYRPSKLMFYEAHRLFSQRGNRRLNLGSGVGGKKDSLFHFKSGFSGLRAPFSALEFVLDEQKYWSFVTRWKEIHGEPVGTPRNFFPLYRAAIEVVPNE